METKNNIVPYADSETYFSKIQLLLNGVQPVLVFLIINTSPKKKNDDLSLKKIVFYEKNGNFTPGSQNFEAKNKKRTFMVNLPHALGAVLKPFNYEHSVRSF